MPSKIFTDYPANAADNITSTNTPVVNGYFTYATVIYPPKDASNPPFNDLLDNATTAAARLNGSSDGPLGGCQGSLDECLCEATLRQANASSPLPVIEARAVVPPFLWYRDVPMFTTMFGLNFVVYLVVRHTRAVRRHEAKSMFFFIAHLAVCDTTLLSLFIIFTELQQYFQDTGPIPVEDEIRLYGAERWFILSIRYIEFTGQFLLALDCYIGIVHPFRNDWLCSRNRMRWRFVLATHAVVQVLIAVTMVGIILAPTRTHAEVCLGLDSETLASGLAAGFRADKRRFQLQLKFAYSETAPRPLLIFSYAFAFWTLLAIICMYVHAWSVQIRLRVGNRQILVLMTTIFSTYMALVVAGTLHSIGVAFCNGDGGQRCQVSSFRFMILNILDNFFLFSLRLPVFRQGLKELFMNGISKICPEKQWDRSRHSRPTQAVPERAGIKLHEVVVGGQQSRGDAVCQEGEPPRSAPQDDDNACCTNDATDFCRGKSCDEKVSPAYQRKFGNTYSLSWERIARRPVLGQARKFTPAIQRASCDRLHVEDNHVCINRNDDSELSFVGEHAIYTKGLQSNNLLFERQIFLLPPTRRFVRRNTI